MVTSTYVTNLGMCRLAVQGSSARFLLCSCINWPTGPPSKATTAVYAYITHTMLSPHCTNVPKTCVLQARRAPQHKVHGHDNSRQPGVARPYYPCRQQSANPKRRNKDPEQQMQDDFHPAEPNSK